MKKEAHFWENGVKGRRYKLREYMRRYHSNSSELNQLLFKDATPRYIFSNIRDLRNNNATSIARNLAAIFPNTTKYLVIMREPVARLKSDFNFFYTSREDTPTRTRLFYKLVGIALTNYNYCRKNRLLFNHGYMRNQCNVSRHEPTAAQLQNCHRGAHDASCIEWLTRPERRLAIGTYSVYIKHWLKYHSREQFLFLQLEEFSAATTATLVDTVLPFLGVNATLTEIEQANKSENKVVNKSKRKFTMLNKVHALLEEFYRPFNQELSQLLQDNKYLWQH